MTTTEPLFQTMREGLQSYRFDVAQGKYRVSLLFTEPNRAASEESIYNLGSDISKNSDAMRSFDILINNTKVEENLNLARAYGVLQAVWLDYEINTDGPVEIIFEPKTGKSVLSGIMIEKL